MKKNTLLVLTVLITFFSCKKEPKESEKSVWQVYEELDNTIYKSTEFLVGYPSTPSIVLGGHTYSGNEKPWHIDGSITNGILLIDFPDTLSLTDEYSSDLTEGVKIACLQIVSVKNSNKHIALHKLDERKPGVELYYTDKDFVFKTSQDLEYQLKAGWNFYDANNKILTQDINELFDKGYRWQWESHF